MTSPIAINSNTPNPSIVAAGGTFTINVAATSYAEVSHPQIIIGASLYSASTGYISDAAHDTKVTISSGANNVSRLFTVPAATPAGLYDLVTSFCFAFDGDNVCT